MQTKPYEILVIGAGPAGLTAAIYTAWLGLKTLVLESGIAGGKAWTAPMIENFPGFDEGIKGSDLAEKMQRQTERLGAEVVTSQEVVGLELSGDVKRVSTRKQTYDASVVVLAMGTQKRKLHVPGEEDFLGRGVSYCAVCDGPFFRGAKVAVVGNGNEAALEALSLAEITESVLFVYEGDLEIEGKLLSRLKSKPKIETLQGKVTAITGEHTVKAVKIQTDAGISEQQVKGVFIALGSVPLTAIVRNAGVAMDSNGCIMVDRQQRTNIEGVFAAGDCTCGGMQVVTAAGEGAMAAMRASGYLRRKER
ncbi:MAG: NAD(P)/FAD-dependent oxidoreductase [Candidatus Bathyarchaeia archaeon]|jgi:thioredoxin reductase (NADPH)